MYAFQDKEFYTLNRKLLCLFKVRGTFCGGVYRENRLFPFSHFLLTYTHFLDFQVFFLNCLYFSLCHSFTDHQMLFFLAQGTLG